MSLSGPGAGRAIDHLVLTARRLEAARSLYERLGFQVGVRNRHPWGTENHIVQFDGAFLELIGLGDGVAAEMPAREAFSFGGFIAQSLARREGLAMLALATGDAAADATAFRAAGVGHFDPLAFGRSARRPDGSTVEVGFTLAFAESRLMPEAAFFTCQNRFPQNFWNAAFQVHPNGATGIKGAIMVAENPSAHAEFLSHVTGQREMRATSAGLEIDTGGARIDVLSQAACVFRYGAAAVEGGASPTRFVGYRIAARGGPHLRGLLAANGVPFDDRGACLVVPPATAFGAALIFEPHEPSSSA